MRIIAQLFAFLSFALSLFAAPQQQSKPVDPLHDWSALRDSAKIAPLEPTAPANKEDVFIKSTTAAKAADEELAALRECGSINVCTPDQLEQHLNSADVAVRAAIGLNIEAMIAQENDLKAQQAQLSDGVKAFSENQSATASYLAKNQDEIHQATANVDQLNSRAIAILKSNLNPTEKATQIDAINEEIRLRTALIDSQQALARSLKRGLDMAEPQRSTFENQLRALQSRITTVQQARQNLEAVSELYALFFSGKKLELAISRQAETRGRELPNNTGTLLTLFDSPAGSEGDEAENAAARSKLEQSEAERMKKINACVEKGRPFIVCYAEVKR